MTVFDLTGRRAFVSGAAGHLGAAMARGLADAGATVVLNGRNEERLNQLADDMAGDNLAVEVAAFDITDEASRQTYFADLSRLDVLVNNAYAGKTGAWDVVTEQDFRDAYEVGTVSCFGAIQDATPALKAAAQAAGQSSIINIGSMYGSVSPDPRIYHTSGFDNPASYGAAKAALLQMTRYAATNLAADHIRVNCISPGPFPPPNLEKDHPEFYRDLIAKVPMGRIGRAAELVGSVVFLASDASSFVTGIELPVDGGWRTW